MLSIWRAEELNAMILPCPLNDGEDIVPVDLSQYPGNLFADCERCFESALLAEDEDSLPRDFSFEPKLAVINVGSYKVSLARSLEDLRRIDENVFRVEKDIEVLLAKHYGKGFGFVICLFQKNLKAHPIGYMASRLPKGALFVPTMHEHGNGDQDNVAIFDHEIYAINATGLQKANPDDRDLEQPPEFPNGKPNLDIKWAKIFEDGEAALDGDCKSISKLSIHGQYRNGDQLVGV